MPGKVILGRTVPVCLTLLNTGNLPEPQATISLPVPAGTALTATTDGGTPTNNFVVWEISDLPVNTAKQVCAVFRTLKTDTLTFASTASSAAVAPVQSSCETVVVGIPAILLQKADDPDPVSIGDTTTYSVKVTNQGTADDSNVQIVVTIAPELVPVSSAEGVIDGQTVTLPLTPKLAPKAAVSYQIIAKGVSAGVGLTKFTLSSDMLKSPISAEESTTVY